MLEPSEADALDRRVEDALLAGDDAGLHVLGYGEVTLVLGWPPDQPTRAVKRLPVFPDALGARRYEAVLCDYLDELAARGIEPVATEVVRHARDDGSVAVYVVQPLLPPDAMATSWMANAGDRAPELLDRVVELVVQGVDDDVGIDAQLTNWAVGGDPEPLRYFDVTTPFLRRNGESLLDIDLFLSALPAFARPPVKRFVATDLLARYHRPRDVLLDFAANLERWGFADLRSYVVAAAARHLDDPFSLRDLDRYYRSEARLWRFMLAARRVDRAWQRHVRRRPYPFLLPESSEW